MSIEKINNQKNDRENEIITAVGFRARDKKMEKEYVFQRKRLEFERNFNFQELEAEYREKIKQAEEEAKKDSSKEPEVLRLEEELRAIEKRRIPEEYYPEDLRLNLNTSVDNKFSSETSTSDIDSNSTDSQPTENQEVNFAGNNFSSSNYEIQTAEINDKEIKSTGDIHNFQPNISDSSVIEGISHETDFGPEAEVDFTTTPRAASSTPAAESSTKTEGKDELPPLPNYKEELDYLIDPQNPEVNSEFQSKLTKQPAVKSSDKEKPTTEIIIPEITTDDIDDVLDDLFNSPSDEPTEEGNDKTASEQKPKKKEVEEDWHTRIANSLNKERDNIQKKTEQEKEKTEKKAKKKKKGFWRRAFDSFVERRTKRATEMAKSIK